MKKVTPDFSLCGFSHMAELKALTPRAKEWLADRKAQHAPSLGRPMGDEDTLIISPLREDGSYGSDLIAIEKAGMLIKMTPVDA